MVERQPLNPVRAARFLQDMARILAERDEASSESTQRGCADYRIDGNGSLAALAGDRNDYPNQGPPRCSGGLMTSRVDA